MEWSGPTLHRGSRVVLLDDVVTTGGTMRALGAACEAQGWEVVGEVVAMRRSLAPSGIPSATSPQ